MYVCISIYVHTYVHTHTSRGRERGRERQKERGGGREGGGALSDPAFSEFLPRLAREVRGLYKRPVDLKQLPGRPVTDFVETLREGSRAA